jgi:hypothetical protein
MRTLSLSVLSAVCLLGISHAALAQTPPQKSAAATNAAAVPQVPMVAPAPAEAGLDLTKTPTDEQRPITETWWFWAAAGGVVVTTVAIVLVAGRSQEEPKTTLGDMRAFR